MALRSSKKIETEMPFGVGAVYKTSGFVESDIVVESCESQNSHCRSFIVKRHLSHRLSTEINIVSAI